MGNDKGLYATMNRRRIDPSFVVWDGYPLSYKIRESKLFPKLFSRFLCVFKIKAYLCNQDRLKKEVAMPKIFEYFGFIFLFYSNEHEPIHVQLK